MLPRQQHVFDALNACIAACECQAAAAVVPEDYLRQRRSMQLSRDCADLCRLAAAFVMREAEHTAHLLRECAELCRVCADACGEFSHERCRSCTEACRRAEDACRTAFVQSASSLN